jgi:hypothetical protein
MASSIVLPLASNPFASIQGKQQKRRHQAPFFSMSCAMPFSLKEWGLTANELSLATIATLISIFVALHY